MIKCLVILVAWAFAGFIAGFGSMIVALAIRFRKGMDELEWGEIVTYIMETRPSWFNIWFFGCFRIHHQIDSVAGSTA